jgi:hypothetical protein
VLSGVNKLFVCAVLNDVPVREHDDPIACGGLGETMRDDYAGAFLTQLVQDGFQTGPTGVIGFCCDLVKHNDLGVDEADAGECQHLCLCAGELMSSCAQYGVQTVR